MKIYQLKLFIVGFLFLGTLFKEVKAGNHPTGADAAGMSNAVVMRSSLWSIYHNQAGLAWLEKPIAGISYSNEYFVNELSTSAIAAMYPTKTGNFGISMTYFGFSQYNETKFGLAYAKKLGKRFSAGIQLDYFNTHIGEDYGDNGIAVAEIGIMAQPIDDLWIGMHLFNPWQAKLADYNDERLETAIRFGMGYTFSEKVMWTVETEKALDTEILFRTGLAYKIVENLAVRAGMQTKSQNLSFGLGYKLKNLSADLAFTHDYILGFTSKYSMVYVFGK